MDTPLASRETLEKVVTALKGNHFEAMIVPNKSAALAYIATRIPKGASVMNGSSETLREIGFIDHLKSGAHEWNNLHHAILEETDPAKQGLLRRQSVVSDFYLGSVHALSETGELVIASNTGSQLPHLAFTSPNVILVVGAQKIRPTLAEALTRVEREVVPLEDARMHKAYGFGTTYAKTLILHKENPALGRKVEVLLVEEALGF